MSVCGWPHLPVTYWKGLLALLSVWGVLEVNLSLWENSFKHCFLSSFFSPLLYGNTMSLSTAVRLLSEELQKGYLFGHRFQMTFRALLNSSPCALAQKIWLLFNFLKHLFIILFCICWICSLLGKNIRLELQLKHTLTAWKAKAGICAAWLRNDWGTLPSPYMCCLADLF